MRREIGNVAPPRTGTQFSFFFSFLFLFPRRVIHHKRRPGWQEGRSRTINFGNGERGLYSKEKKIDVVIVRGDVLLSLRKISFYLFVEDRFENSLHLSLDEQRLRMFVRNSNVRTKRALARNLEKSIWRIVARESGALTPLRISWRITSYRQAIVDMYVYMFFRFLLKDQKDSCSFLCWLKKLYQWRFFVCDEEENYYRGWNVLLLLHNFPFPLLF